MRLRVWATVNLVSGDEWQDEYIFTDLEELAEELKGNLLKKDVTSLLLTIVPQRKEVP